VAGPTAFQPDAFQNDAFQIDASVSYPYTGGGGLVLGGAALTAITGGTMAYAGSGGIVLGGAAITALTTTAVYAGTGGIVLGGAAITLYTPGAVETVIISGSGGGWLLPWADARNRFRATVVRILGNHYAYQGRGGLRFGGAAATRGPVVRRVHRVLPPPQQHYRYRSAGGVIQLGGAASTGLRSSFAYIGSGLLVLSGAAATRLMTIGEKDLEDLLRMAIEDPKILDVLFGD